LDATRRVNYNDYFRYTSHKNFVSWQSLSNYTTLYCTAFRPVTLIPSVTYRCPCLVPCYLKPETCNLQLATLSWPHQFSYSPAIVGGFQENNLRLVNRMLLESFIVLERLPVEGCVGKAQSCHKIHGAAECDTGDRWRGFFMLPWLSTIFWIQAFVPPSRLYWGLSQAISIISKRFHLLSSRPFARF
jgi:hypothetical protein